METFTTLLHIRLHAIPPLSRVRPDDTTLGMVRSILAAAGEVAESNWGVIRQLINRPLLERLLKLDPDGTWVSVGGSVGKGSSM